MERACWSTPTHSRRETSPGSLDASPVTWPRARVPRSSTSAPAISKGGIERWVHMADPLNVAVAGLVHDHIWGTLDHLREDGRAVLVAVADDNEPLRRRVVEEYGAGNAYAHVADLLERETVDAIVCGSENNRHAELV